jgi:GNAT superfamily N-acetyltransferase
MPELTRIETYYDTVPRALASMVEDVGPFTLFGRSGGWPYYARPRLGYAGPFAASDVQRVRDRQCSLGVPEAFEWIDEVSPGIAAAAQETGLTVHRHQLLVLDELRPAPTPAGIDIRSLPAGDPAIAASRAAVKLGFRADGTGVGPIGSAERDAEVRAGDQAAEFVSDCIDLGLMVTAVAEDETGPIAGGSYAPRDGVAEITGIATLPAARRRGIGAALTSRLVEDATQRGVELCFLSAETDAVARIYQRLGFRTVATAVVAEL